jgi:hypothetical protein
MRGFNPLSSLMNCLAALVAGRLYFPRARVGESLELDGERWVIFRQAVRHPAPGQPARPGAGFHVRFRVAARSPQAHIRFSLLPIPFFVGLPGFRSKLWLHNPATGEFQGRYEWDSVAAATRYAHSFAMRFMAWRAVPDSLAFEIVPQPGEPARTPPEAPSHAGLAQS